MGSVRGLAKVNSTRLALSSSARWLTMKFVPVEGEYEQHDRPQDGTSNHSANPETNHVGQGSARERRSFSHGRARKMERPKGCGARGPAPTRVPTQAGPARSSARELVNTLLWIYSAIGIHTHIPRQATDGRTDGSASFVLEQASRLSRQGQEGCM
jgi:hypothetical protein